MAIQDTTKIYRIEVPGIEVVIDKVQQLTREFELQKAVKKDADKLFNAAKKDYDTAIQQQRQLADTIANQRAIITSAAKNWKDFIKDKIEGYTKELGYKAALQQLSVEWKAYQANISRTSVELKNNEKAMLEFAAKEQAATQVMNEQTQVIGRSQVEMKKLAAEKRIANREADAMIKAAEKTATAMVNEANAIQFASGSVNEATANYKALLNLANSVGEDGLIEWKGEVIGIEQAEEKLRGYRRTFEDFQRRLSKDGTIVADYTTGIVQAFKQMGLDDLVKNQIDGAKKQLNSLDTQFESLKSELNEVRKAGTGGFEAIERQLIDNRNEAARLERQVKEVETAFKSVGGIGGLISRSISEGFKDAKRELGQLVVGYIGFQAAISGISSAVSNAKIISDQTTDLEINLNATADAAVNLTDKLKEIDTRTTVIGLQQIADVSLRAGVARENILDVTEAVDKVKIAFGKDFGDVEEGTETFAKLINIFYEDGEITGERILKIGNAIRTVANESSASVPYINDFSGRMAGLKQITNIALSDVIGLGAGFETLKQSSEVASTALVKVIPQLASDVEKFSKIAGVSTEEFTKLLNSNPAEALIKFSEGLVKTGGSLEEISQSFSDAELEAGRVITVLGTLGGKSDLFREQIRKAGKAVNETTAIQDAFDKKNQNLAATIDKINKKFTDVAASRLFQLSVLAVATALSFLLSLLPVILTLVTLYGTTWAIANAAMIRTRIVTLASNLAFQAQYAWLVISQTAIKAYTVAMNFMAAATQRAAASSAFLGTVMRLLSGPIGIILAIIGLLTLSVAAFARGAYEAGNGLNALLKQKRAMIDVTRAASVEIAKETGELNRNFKAATDVNSTQEQRKKGIENLQRLFPEYFGNLNKERATIEQLTKAYDDATASIRRKAFAQSSTDLATKSQKKVNEVAELEIILDTEFKNGQGMNRVIKGLTDEQTELIKSGINLSQNTLRANNGVASFAEKDFPAIMANLKRLREGREEVTKLYTDLSDKFNKEVEVNTVGRTITAIKKDLETANKDFETAVIGSQAKKDLEAKIKRLNKELRDAQIKDDPSGGRSSRLTGEQKDLFKDIDAERDKALTDEKIKRSQNQIDEQTYLNNILTINKQAIDKKLGILKGANAEERKQIAELKLEKISLEQDTNKKLFEIEKDRIEAVKKLAIDAAQDEFEKINNDPNATALQKSDAQVQLNDRLLNIQRVFATEMDNLEKRYAQQSITNANERTRAVNEIEQRSAIDRAENIRISFRTRLEQVGMVEDYKKMVIEIQRQEKILDVLRKKRLTDAEKDKEIQKINGAAVLQTIDQEIDAVKKKIFIYNLQYGVLAAINKEYRDLVANLAKLKTEKKQQEEDNKKTGAESLRLPGQGAAQQFITAGLTKAIGLNSENGEDKLLGDIIAGSFDLALESMNAYFDAEEARIRRSLDVQNERLDIEKAQKLEQAQTEAERISIEEQTQEKRKQLEKQAQERLKKVKKSEAKISLATELANIAAAAAGNPANAFTFGAAGAIMYAVLAGLALARYAQNIKNIEAATFEKGGSLNMVVRKGGIFQGRSHKEGGNKFLHRGRPVETEAEEAFVINKRSMGSGKVMTVTGTVKQIASAINQEGGGVSFAPGASVKYKTVDGVRYRTMEYGGSLGENLNAPEDPSSFLNPGSYSQADMSDLKDMVAVTQQTILEVSEQTNKRIDKIQVVQETRTVTAAQKKQVKQDSITTL
jgi:hypothetical protein